MGGPNTYLHSLLCKDSIHINDSKAFWKGKVVTLRAMKEYGGTECIFALVFFGKIVFI